MPTSNPKARDIVLVVDDSPETLGLLTDALDQAELTVLVALEGARALSLVDEVTPDVILMDAIMPGMDGFETCRRLKREKGLGHVPVIFMTGLSETEHIVAGFAAGGADYITKPIVPEVVIARMHAHLANARLTHSAHTALDATGRFLLAVNRAGTVLWSTPQASALLAQAFGPPGRAEDAEPDAAPAAFRRWLARWQASRGGGAETVRIESAGSDRQLQLAYVGQIGPDEFLLRLVDRKAPSDEAVLKERLPITLREAEVLVWIARGKSNRDIGEILGLSPRTVNKHLEQVFAKLGVENRASAAALAIRTVTAATGG
jgi:DNA-binding NarL/FixJ family response regulator